MNVRGWERANQRGRADGSLLLALVAFVLWAIASMAWSGGQVSTVSPYLVAPPLLAVGVMVGRWQAASPRQWVAPAAAAVLGLAVLFAVPFYANAQAALGVQMVALAGLVLVDGRVDGHRAGRQDSRDSLAALSVGVGALGVLLAARSQAASVLVLLVVLVAALTMQRRTQPSRHTETGVALLAIGLGAISVVVLGSLTRWPATLNAGKGLSSVRHELWSDALALWRQNPVLGGGPDSFVEHSRIAASRVDLAPAHSSILQVGAELGSVGAVLFLAILAAGTAVAAQRGGPRAVIAVTAWSALAVHSMIDHLYEFPLVTLAAGFVIGWASRPGKTGVVSAGAVHG